MCHNSILHKQVCWSFLNNVFPSTGMVQMLKCSKTMLMKSVTKLKAKMNVVNIILWIQCDRKYSCSKHLEEANNQSKVCSQIFLEDKLADF